MSYRKIGGMHWLAAGHYRLAMGKARRYEPISYQWAVLAIGLGLYATIVWSVFGS